MGAPAEATNTVPKPADRRVPYTVRRVTGALEAMPSWKRISRLIRVAARMIQDLASRMTQRGHRTDIIQRT